MYHETIYSLCEDFLDLIKNNSFDNTVIFKIETFENLLRQKTLEEIKSDENILDLYAELVNAVESIDNNKTSPELALFLGMLFGTFYKVMEEKGEKLV